MFGGRLTCRLGANVAPVHSMRSAGQKNGNGNSNSSNQTYGDERKRFLGLA